VLGAWGASWLCPRDGSAAIRSAARAFAIPSPARRSHAKSSDILRKADAIYLEEIRHCPGLYVRHLAAFAVLAPLAHRRVMGYSRSYSRLACAR